MSVVMLPEPTKGVIPVPRPPQDATLTGETAPNGQPVYQITRLEIVRDEHGNVVKDPVIGHDGKPVWMKHATTGEPLYQRMRVRKEMRTRKFTMNIERNELGVATGTVTYNYLYEPDPAEKARIEKAQKVREFQAEFVARAVERGLTVDELLDRLERPGGGEAEVPSFSDPVPEPRQRPPVRPVPEPEGPQEETEDAPVYPRMRGPGLWALSAAHEAAYEADGVKLFKGTREAATKAMAELEAGG